MISALLVLSMVSQQQTMTLTLAADTFLDRRAAEVNVGREPLLESGIDKPILISFPELGRNVGANKRVRSARLVFTVARPGTPRLASVGRMLAPWVEGGFRAEQFGLATPPKATGTATWTHAVLGDVKWERDGAAGRNDAEPVSGVTGALNEDSFVLSGLESAVQAMVDRPESNFGLRLGFENPVSFFSADSMGSGPQLVVEFEDRDASDVDLVLVSCEPTTVDLSNPPRVAASIEWRAVVKNVGTAEASGLKLRLLPYGADESETNLAGVIPSGGERTFEFSSTWRGPLSVRIEPGAVDAKPSDNGLRIYPHGLSIHVTGAAIEDVQRVVTDLNERVFPFSKFGAWPAGVQERLRLTTVAERAVVKIDAGDKPLRRAILQGVTGLTDAMLRPYTVEPPRVGNMVASTFTADKGQAGLLPDTRDDVLIPRSLAIPGLSTNGGGFAEIPMTEHKMLSRSEVTILNTLAGKRERALPWDMTTNAIFLRVFTAEGPPPPGTKLELYQMIGGAFGSQPVYSQVLEAGGAVLLTGRPGGEFGKSNPFGDLAKDGSNAWMLAVVRSGERVDSAWIPVWQLWDEYARGNQAAAFLEVRVQLLDANIDRTQNLAQGKLATDAKGRFPAELMALTDGKVETAVSFGSESPDYWIEIDLGRDRTLAEVSLVFDGPAWKQFKIVTYKTAQSAAESVVWAEENNATTSASMTTSPDGKTLMSYMATPVRSRFLRIIPLTREAVKLSEIRVVPGSGG